MMGIGGCCDSSEACPENRFYADKDALRHSVACFPLFHFRAPTVVLHGDRSYAVSVFIRDIRAIRGSLLRSTTDSVKRVAR